MGHVWADFIDAYNDDLIRMGCKVRVLAPNDVWHAGSLQIVDLEGNSIGIMPRSIETIELAAFMHILDKTYQRGVIAGRAMGAQLDQEGRLSGA